MMLTSGGGCLKTGVTVIKRGIFQGDSLSPLLFCMTLIPLSNALRKKGKGYIIHERELSHLLYKDDLKLFAANQEHMKTNLRIVEKFTKDIQMEFGIEKCATAKIKQGKVMQGKNTQLTDSHQIIRSLEVDEFYKYLGMEENNGVNNKVMKENVKKEYYRRIRKILTTELNAKNKIMAIKSLAIPVLTYGFGIIQWLKLEIEKIDRKTRKILTINGMHHPRADVQRLYVKRKNGGRGLLEVWSVYQQAILGLSEYIELENSRLIQIVKLNDSLKKKYSVSKEASKIQNKYMLKKNNGMKMTDELKERMQVEKLEEIKRKPLHGQFLRNMEKAGISKEMSVSWLNCSGLKGEIESLIIAAQDQVLKTRYYQKHILKQDVSSTCRLCHRSEEHIGHIIAGCQMLAPTEYTERHNKVAAYIHWKICKNFDVPVTEKYYLHKPQPVVSIDDITLMWDQGVLTDRTIPANRPDIIFLDRKEKHCLLIEISIPDDQNVMKKLNEKILKYKDLQIEVSRMWKVEVKTTPVIVGALGMIEENCRKELEKIPGKLSQYEVQKIALNGTAHTLRKILG